jgi:subtilase family serine protease
MAVTGRRFPHLRLPTRHRWMTAMSTAGATVLAVSALATASSPSAARGAVTPGGRIAVAGARPIWATNAVDRGNYKLPASISARVYLAGRDPQGLRAYATAAATPGNPLFRHYLTPAQVLARFGPTAGQISAVRGWLSADGLRVTGVTRHYVAVTGSMVATERAFGVAIHTFAAQGGTHYAPTGQVTVPNAVAPAVLGVTGLDNGRPTARPQDTLPGPPSTIFRAGPCSKYYGQNRATNEPFTYQHVGLWTTCGMTPQQIRSAYGADTSGLTGAGVTVAVVDPYASPTMAADVTSYARATGTPGFRPGQFTQTLPSSFNNVANCGGNFWYSEESLDIEALHAMAPGANVDYVSAPSCFTQDLTDTLSNIVDNHLATIVSNSWGLGPHDTNTQAQIDALDQVFQDAAAEGIGMYFASGDCGAEDPATSCGQAFGSDKPQPDFPPDDPFVTAVGGTSVAIGSDGHQLFQSGWGNSLSSLNADHSGWTPSPGSGYPGTYDAGSGGGTSYAYSQPQYQKGVVPSALATTFLDGTTAATPMRVVPDISMDADNNSGFLVGETTVDSDGVARFHATRFGGTSLAAPLFAGIQALAQQAQGGAPIGFANPQIYARYGTSAIQDVTDTPFGAGVLFGVVRDDYTNTNDPTSPVTTQLNTFAHDGLLHGVAGYDDETGLGAPSAGSYFSSYRS